MGTDKEKGAGSPVASLFVLYARGSLWKLSAVLAGMVLAEGSGFYMACRRLERSGEVLSFEKMLDQCALKYIFLAALALVYFILIVTQGDRDGCKSSYTLYRLRVSKKGQFAARSVYNFLCLMIVLAVQVLAAFVFCRLYETRLPAELVSPQYLFLAFYRNEFLHCILPMADWEKWVCVLLLLLALAMDAACTVKWNGGGNKNGGGDRDGHQNWGGESAGFGRKKGADGSFKNGALLSVLNYNILLQWFVTEIHSPLTLLCILYCVMLIAVALLRLFGVIGGGRDEKV